MRVDLENLFRRRTDFLRDFEKLYIKRGEKNVFVARRKALKFYMLLKEHLELGKRVHAAIQELTKPQEGNDGSEVQVQHVP